MCDILNVRHYYAVWLWTFNGNSTILDERIPSPYYSQTAVKFDDHRMTMVLDVINASERHSGLYECSIFELVWLEKNNITLIVDEKGNRGRVFLDSFYPRLLIIYSRRMIISLRYEPALLWRCGYQSLLGDFLNFPNVICNISNTRNYVLPRFHNRENTINYNAESSVFGEIRGDWRWGKTLFRVLDKPVSIKAKTKRKTEK